MNTSASRSCLFSSVCLFLAALTGCTPADEPPADPDAAIRAEVESMADDFVNLRMLTGFVHEMPLAEAYRWQDAMVEILPMGEVVGYKTGGHDPNHRIRTSHPAEFGRTSLRACSAPTATRSGWTKPRPGFSKRTSRSG